MTATQSNTNQIKEITDYTELRHRALATFWECDVDEISECRYDETRFEIGSHEFRVLTDEEDGETFYIYRTN